MNLNLRIVKALKPLHIHCNPKKAIKNLFEECMFLVSRLERTNCQLELLTLRNNISIIVGYIEKVELEYRITENKYVKKITKTVKYLMQQKLMKGGKIKNVKFSKIR